MRTATAIVCLAAGLWWSGGAPGAAPAVSPVAEQTSAPPQQGVPAPERIVSLVPALTEILFAIGAGSQVVGVSSFDTFPPEVQALPRVGALLDPDTERVLSLRPDLIITYASQDDAERRFSRAGIRTYSYRHEGVAGVFDTIRTLGAVTGHEAGAVRLARDLQATLDEVRARVKGRPRPRTLLVLERQPGTLRGIYASGGAGFLHEILDAAGGTNVFADVAGESVQPSHETLIREAPEVVIELRATGGTGPAELRDVQAAWSALASIPAVRNGRLHLLTGQYLVIAGPRLGAATEAIARALHPQAFR